MTAQSIKLPPHLAALPTSHLTLPAPSIYTHTHTKTHTHSHCFSTNTRLTSSLRSNRGGSDELPHKSYGCFSLTGDSFKPSLSVFMFFLFRPCLDFCKIQKLCKLTAQQLSVNVLLTFFENRIYIKVRP